jgi:hypothetical protein
MGKCAGFFIVVAFIHIVILPHEIKNTYLARSPILKKGLESFNMRQVMRMKEGKLATLTTLIVGMIWCAIAHVFGFHPAIGAYMGGLIMEIDYFEMADGESLFHTVYEHIETVAYTWMGPFFFLELGSTIIMDFEMFKNTIFSSVIMFVLLFIGQFLSAALAAKYVPGGFTWADSVMIGFGMMGRAELFFVVLELCTNTYDLMTGEMMFTFAMTAMLMNIAVPVTITLYKPWYVKWTGYGKENEKEALEVAHGRRPSQTFLGEEMANYHPGAKGLEAGLGQECTAAYVPDEIWGKGGVDHNDITVEVPRGVGSDAEDAADSHDFNADDTDLRDKRPKGKKSMMPMVCGCLTADVVRESGQGRGR